VIVIDVDCGLLQDVPPLPEAHNGNTLPAGRKPYRSSLSGNERTR
jgi:hypothetical protein